MVWATPRTGTSSGGQTYERYDIFRVFDSMNDVRWRWA